MSLRASTYRRLVIEFLIRSASLKAERQFIDSLSSAAFTVESGAFFNHESGRGNLTFNVRSTTENEFFRCLNISLNSTVDLRDCYFNDSFCYLCAGTDN